MSSEFQIIPVSGNFSSPLIDVTRDVDDYYGDSGAPNYSPVNLNDGIDLKNYTIDSGVLVIGQAYMWRMRYRDQNVRWSDWSDTLQFLVTPLGIARQDDDHGIFVSPNPSGGNQELFFNTDGGQMEISVVDINGRNIRDLFSGHLPSGNQRLTWDGKNDNGNDVAPGIYLCRFRSNGYDKVVKIVRQY
jgi:hypothetical protein